MFESQMRFESKSKTRSLRERPRISQISLNKRSEKSLDTREVNATSTTGFARLPHSKEANDLNNIIAETTRPVGLDEIAEILDSTIRHDRRNKLITFLGMILTYTAEDQINVSFTAESSSGKSYIPLELAWYFPKKDIIEYSYVSPTAFFHEYGTLRADPTDTRTMDEEKKRKIIQIDLHQKILVFIDQPHDLLLQRLRPLLSHDRKTLVAKITDRRKIGGLATKTVLINGFPTVLFCTAKFSMQDQERTRLLLLSPEITPEKIRDAILLKIEKDSNREAFHDFMESDPRRTWLASRVELISSAGIEHIIIPEELRTKIADEFFQTHKDLIPRHQRDIGRLLALIKAHALLNLWQRQRIGNAIVANSTDFSEGLKLYVEISTANELGLPPEVFNVFLALKEKVPDSGATRKQLRAFYYQTFHRTIGTKRLDETLNLLESVGLLADEPDPSNRSQKLFVLTPQGVCVEDPEERDDHEDVTHTPRCVSNPPDAPDRESLENLSSSTEVKRPSVQQALEFVRERFVDGTEEEWVSLAVERGLSEADAETLFERLKGDELFWHDTAEGKTVWRWVK